MACAVPPRAPRYAMPSPLARLDGDSTRLDRGSLRHTAPSTSRPKVASAVPYGRGSTRGSLTATPWAMTGRGAGFDPHPAISSAITAAPATARSSFLMRIGRIARRSGGIEMITLVIELLLPAMASVRREAPHPWIGRPARGPATDHRRARARADRHPARGGRAARRGGGDPDGGFGSQPERGRGGIARAVPAGRAHLTGTIR